MREDLNAFIPEKGPFKTQVLENLTGLFAFDMGRPVKFISEDHKKRRGDALFEIDILEEKKKQILFDLERELDSIESGEGIEVIDKDARSVGFDQDLDIFFIFGKKGSKIPISKGELLTDSRWGVSYKPDISVPRETRIDYVTRRAINQLSHIHNLQIALNESTRGENDFDEEAFSAVLTRERKRGDMEEEMDNGGLAERVVLSLLDRLSIDHDLSFTVEETDPYQDVKGKIDFIIHFKDGYNRGAKINQNEKIHDIGVQLTVSINEGALAYKQGQINRATRRRESSISDVVLVSIPLKDMKNLYIDWKEENKKRSPGGPDKLLSKEQQEKIFRGILQKLPEGVMNEEDISKIFKEV